MIDALRDFFERIYKGEITQIALEADNDHYQLARDFRLQIVDGHTPCSVKLVPDANGLHIFTFYNGTIFRRPSVEVAELKIV